MAKKTINLDQVILNPDQTEAILERKYKLNEKGGPVVENGQPVILEEKKFTLRAALIAAVNHYSDSKMDLGQIVERGKLVIKLRECKAQSFSIPPTMIEPIKENLVHLGYTPYTILQVVEALDGKASA
ncbi:MAG: hypothetical protein LCH37_09850 [Bacteroidetes bacterium]|nr:hypothetical protein [Bacteroidota bacterium]